MADILASDYINRSSGGNGTFATQLLTTSGSVLAWGTLVEVDCSSNNIIVTLPVTNIGTKGQEIIIKRIDNTNNTLKIIPYGTETLDYKTEGVYLYNLGDSIRIESKVGNSIIGSDNRNSTGSSASYLYAERTSAQTTNIAVNNPIIFTNATKQIGSNATIDTGTGIVTLKPNSSYSIKCGLGVIVGTNTGTEYILQKSTDGGSTWTQIGDAGFQFGTNYSFSYGRETMAHANVDTPVTTYIRVIIATIVGVTGIGNGSGYPWIEVSEISRQATILNTVDYLNVARITSGQTISAGTDFIFNSKVSGSIPYNITTGVATLTAGNTYELTAEPSFDAFSDTSTGFVSYDWVDSTTNVTLSPSNQSLGIQMPINRNAPEASNGQSHLIYTPTTNQNVKLRCISISGTVNLRYGAGSKATIKQIGSSAVSNIPDSLLTSVVTAGDVKMTARTTAPEGWLICNGSAISRTTYASLFNAIGTVYGTGDGSTTFNIPDLRGRVPRGYVNINTITGSGTITNNNATFTNHGLNRTGFKVRLQSGTIAGLTVNTTYYVIVIDSNTLAFSTTFANAIAGTKITISGTNSGVLTQWEDPDASSRTASTVGGNTGNTLGTIQDSATKLPNSSFTTSNSGNHIHGIPIAFDTGADYYTYESGEVRRATMNSDAAGDHVHTINGGGDNETRMPNIAINYIIKY